jgi:glycosyltransferase involved in cell wall biosynthesis
VRVLQVVGTFDPRRDGVAHYAACLSQVLASVGLDVSIAAGPAGIAKSPVDVVPIEGIPHRVRGALNVVLAARRFGANVIHVQYAPSSYAGHRAISLIPLIVRLLPNRPRLVTTIHEFGGANFGHRNPRLTDRIWAAGERLGWFDRETLMLLGASDRVVATNVDHLAALRARSKVIAGRAWVIPIGPNVSPDAAQSRAEARASFELSDDQAVGAFFGFVHPVKGIETLLQALRLARQDSPRLRLWIVGGVESLALRGGEADTYEHTIRRLIRDLELADVVDLTGYLDDAEVARRLRAADFAVLPFNRGVTLKSGTLVTALSFGLPTIATRGGNLGDLRHGDSIWLVAPRDTRELADALRAFSQDGALRASLSAAARPLSARFSWEAIASRHLQLYEKARKAT